ncbi:ABC transporter substrate-binding protein [Anaerosinus massiliensis]|uniref:ABC transporter substrate-binding protein n=1 Tax=Massilibacillus massiliensis TaxID=1806837 RepID=UPI000ACAB76D|nr:ABC transporter substrate-binding protein [Massilibacillus massiliensis]
MKKLCVYGATLAVLFFVFLSGCARQNAWQNVSKEEGGHSRIIVDMAGRKVAVPTEIKKVYPVSPVEAVLLYTIDPALLVGWGYHMASDQADYILPQYRDLPVIGWLNRGSTGNLEEVMKLKPDVILMSDEVNAANIEFANELEKSTKIPVVFLAKGIDNMQRSYIVAGELLNRETRTAELAAYCRETTSLVAQKKPLLEKRQPATAYYAEGRLGLETEPRGSWHAEVIEYVGGRNVAEPGLPSSSSIGRSPVSIEQVMNWNPEVILIGYFRDGESSSYPSIMQDEAWQHVKAVQNRQVYEIPTGPFNWFDRPPSVARLLGIRWVANLLYPDMYAFDFRAEVKRFYALFYQYELSEAELDALAASAERK